MIDFGTVRPGRTLYVPFSSFASSTGASITLTGLAVTDIEIYKDGGTTQRASDNGYTLLDTDGIDFDGLTGIHGFSIDLADNSTAGFYAAGSQYFAVVSTVTVDSQTVSFLAARWQIGYPEAILNTTIATLSSQTSFTLTSGPAEDDALNGLYVVIHDVASLVQLGWALILDYTGSTKTVTLAAGTTFTAATTDNVSVMAMAPLQPATLGRTALVAADGSVSPNWADVKSPTTTLNLSGTTVKTATDVETDTQDIQSRLPAALVSGRMDSSTGAMAANVLTATAINADAITAAKIATGAIDADALAADAANEIADQVWDEVLSGHLTAGTTGAALNAAGSAGDPWSTTLPGAYGAGTAGKIVGDNVNATISSRASQTSLDTVDDFLDTEIAAIKAKTDNLPSDPADASDIAASFTTVNTKLDTIDDFLDTEVAAIKAKTDNLPADPTSATAVTSQFAVIAGYIDTEIASILAAVDTEIASIKTVTDRLNALVENSGGDRFTAKALETAGGGGLTAAAIADQVWDEVLAGHLTAGTTGAALNVAGGGGSVIIYGEEGSIDFTYTVYKPGGVDPLGGAAVYVSSDLAGTLRSSIKTTDSVGRVVFSLDPGPAYFWTSHPSYSFSNPDTETVS